MYVLGGGDVRSGERGVLGVRKDNPLVGAVRSRGTLGSRRASVMLLSGLGRCGGCWEAPDPEPWLRLTGTLMVVLDLFRGTGLI